MSKKINISIAASGEIKRDVEINPGEKTAEILEKVGLEGYRLARANQPPFGEDEEIYDLVGAGEKVFAAEKREMRRASPALRRFFRNVRNRIAAAVRRLKRQLRGLPVSFPATKTERRKDSMERELPYWRERSWKYVNGAYQGYYRTFYETAKGFAVRRSSTWLMFMINPPKQLKKHKKWECFSLVGETDNGKPIYNMHFKDVPKNLSSGIFEVENVMNEAYMKA
jgi:hypothetical protein